MSTRAKLKRARRLLASADAIIAQLRHEIVFEIMVRNERIEFLRRELDQLDQKVRPYVERIMAVQFETKWYYPILPSDVGVSYFLRDAIPTEPIYRTGVLDTHRKLLVTFAVADEVLLHMLKEAPEGVVDDYFVNVGRQLASKAVKTIRAVQKLPPKAIEAVLRGSGGGGSGLDSVIDDGGD